MIKKITILMLLGLIISCSSNDDDNQINDGLIKSVTDEIGSIGVLNVNGIEKFTINTTVPETIDSVIIGIVDELPTELSIIGTEVIFSGSYTNGENTPSPTLSGQEIYDLTLSYIENNETFEITGEFNHTIMGCDNTDNPEINCIEFMKFIDETKVSILTGGSDIVYIANYEIDGNKIDIETTDDGNISFSFLIQDEMTLKRTENDDIWTKTK